ncbi:hypothetical protein D3C80_1577670 [compost metagenome]
MSLAAVAGETIIWPGSRMKSIRADGSEGGRTICPEGIVNGSIPTSLRRVVPNLYSPSITGETSRPALRSWTYVCNGIFPPSFATS